MSSMKSAGTKTGASMTLEEVARLAGVSRSTVSRVVNDEPNVKATTREHVWQAIRTCDFHPNTAARALAGRRSRIVGLVIPQALNAVFADPYFPTLIQGIAVACDERDYYLMLSLVLRQSDDTFRRLIRAGHMDGLIVSSALKEDQFVARLLDEHFPFVLIGRMPGRTDVVAVDADNARGARTAAHYLARQGYERIATITGPLNMIAAMDRHEGFLLELRSLGIDVPPEYVEEGDWSQGSGTQGMERLLHAPTPPEAVFVASDSMAIGALKAIRAAGLKVPDDVALVGFDDIPMASAVEPPLTTVRQPIDRLGYLAASTLIDLIQADPANQASAGGQQIVLPTELVVRASCGQALRSVASPRSSINGSPEGGVRHK